MVSGTVPSNVTHDQCLIHTACPWRITDTIIFTFCRIEISSALPPCTSIYVASPTHQIH